MEALDARTQSMQRWVIILGCIAFGVFWSAGLFVRIDTTPDELFFHYAGRVTKVVACYAIAVIAWRRVVDPALLFRIANALLIATVAGYVVIFAFSVDSRAADAAVSMLYGASGACYTLLFAQFFSILSPKHSAIGIPFAFMVCHAIFLVSLFVPFSLSIEAMIGASVAGLLLFYVCIKKTGLLKAGRSSPPAAEQALDVSLANSGKPGQRVKGDTFDLKTLKPMALIREYFVVLLGALILPLFYGVVAQFYTEADINAGLFDFTTELVAVVALTATALVCCFERGRQNLEKAFVVLIPLMATALVLTDNRFFFAGAIVKGITILYTSLFWAFLAKKAQGKLQLSFVLFGFAQGTYHLGAMVGRIIGASAHGSFGSAVEMLLAVTLLVIWMLAIIVWHVFSGNRNETKPLSGKVAPASVGGHSGVQTVSDGVGVGTGVGTGAGIATTADVSAANASDPFEKKCLAFASTYALSEREGEVLLHFVHGRSSNAIAHMLFISKNTVKTHLRNIYIKAGIHSRQELLDLIEDGEALP